MRFTMIVICLLGLTTPLQAVVVDDSGRAIATTYRDGYYFFARCNFDAQATTGQQLSACQPLNANNGLQQQDFALLQQRLTAKTTQAERNADRLRKLQWGLIALTTVTVLLTVRKLYKDKVMHVLESCCKDPHHHHHHHHDHHHNHGFWKHLWASLPRFDLDAGKKFFFREHQWLAPTLLSQLLAIVTVGQREQATLDKKTVYEFLQTEILQLKASNAQTVVIHVRSITAVEFMIYEVMRLQQAELETQTTDRR